MNKISDFQNLIVWKQGINIVKEIYGITHRFPKSELFGLTNQMRRAAVSIPSNIAEGYIKRNDNELARYLKIALGSCAELKTQTIIAIELGFIKDDDFAKMMQLIDTELKQINALILKTKT